MNYNTRIERFRSIRTSQRLADEQRSIARSRKQAERQIDAQERGTR